MIKVHMTDRRMGTGLIRNELAGLARQLISYAASAVHNYRYGRKEVEVVTIWNHRTEFSH